MKQYLQFKWEELMEWIYNNIIVKFSNYYLNKIWIPSHTDIGDSTEHLTFSCGSEIYLCYGLDNLWKKIVPNYHIIQNAINKLYRYEQAKINLMNGRLQSIMCSSDPLRYYNEMYLSFLVKEITEQQWSEYCILCVEKLDKESRK